jgi:hypothetical protein
MSAQETEFWSLNMDLALKIEQDEHNERFCNDHKNCNNYTVFHMSLCFLLSFSAYLLCIFALFSLSCYYYYVESYAMLRRFSNQYSHQFPLVPAAL